MVASRIMILSFRLNKFSPVKQNSIVRNIRTIPSEIKMPTSIA